MSTSFSQAVEALTAQAQSLIAMANGELEALREELEQERRFRRHLQATAAARTQEWASLQEAERLEREGLEAELAEALEGRRRAEAEVERFHAAVRDQLAIAEQEQAALEAAEQERERQRQEQLQQRLQEAAQAAARREEELQEAAEHERAGLLQQLDDAQRARQGVERRLAGVRLAVLDLLAPLGTEEEAEEPGSAADGIGRLALHKVLVPRSTPPVSEPVLS